MKLFKKLILTTYITALCTIWIWITNAELNPIWGQNLFPYKDAWTWIEWDKLDFWQTIKENAVEEPEGLLQKLLATFKLNHERYTWPKKALAYAVFLLNYALTFVAFIALCLLIYSFYCVIVWDEKQIDKAKWYLKWIAIAIIVMWLSWLIVSLIFRLYEDIARDTGATLTLIQTFNYLA